ncbi:MAG: hypothetical protein CFH34_01572 [Alphaproteobacteria bacterium MarineAlpha9_Bin4]|nr:MAG: hypothetical protein CFH34_01572 [Alphaproteobacteria bacterium MarineAlpha9_Bin4]
MFVKNTVKKNIKNLKKTSIVIFKLNILNKKNLKILMAF